MFTRTLVPQHVLVCHVDKTFTCVSRRFGLLGFMQLLNVNLNVFKAINCVRLIYGLTHYLVTDSLSSD